MLGDTGLNLSNGQLRCWGHAHVNFGLLLKLLDRIRQILAGSFAMTVDHFARLLRKEHS